TILWRRGRRFKSSRPDCCRSVSPSQPSPSRGEYESRMTSLLLALDFPPMGGGIARFHSEVARRFPAGEMIVSTTHDPAGADADARFSGVVDRLSVGRRIAKTLPGAVLWSSRAARLARRHSVRWVYCGNLKPAGYPACWRRRRHAIPYGSFLYGGQLRSVQV